MRAHAGLFLPLAMAAILAEALLYRQRLDQPYPWKESGVTLLVAIGHNLAQLASRGLLGGIFAWAWAHRLFTVPLDSAWGWPSLFLGAEFLYYWQHRLDHRVRWLWATHAVHHSPNELTLSAAMRLGWTGALSGGGLLFLPLVLLGFQPLAVIGMLGANLFYQFWLHTRLVPRLPWFDRVFNSPSNHRVHHACNPEYLDKNFGGVLIVFDRWFGTYAPEGEAPCRYGLVAPQTSTNPFAVALREWRHLLDDARRARGPRALLRTLFGAPPAFPTTRASL